MKAKSEQIQHEATRDARVRRFSVAVRKSIGHVAACSLILIWSSCPSIAAVVVWDGGGKVPTLWSGSGANGNNNWDTNVAPVNGDDIVFAGTVNLSSSNNITNLSVNSLTFNSGSGAFILLGNKITLNGAITNNSTSIQTINMDLGLNATTTFATTSGDVAVGGVVSGVTNAGINKTGTNQLILSGANTYTGTTTITAGTLLANNTTGSATGSGAINVGVNGVLGGTGIIIPTGTNNISVSGLIAPGEGTTPGTLTFNLSTTTGSISMNSGAGFQFHLGSIGICDMISIVGASSGDFAFNNNNVNFMGTGQLGSYKLFDTDSNNANTWTGLTFGSNGQITGGLTYNNLANGYTATFYLGGGSTYGGDSGDIYVRVIPEPDAALIGGIGILLLLLRRRRSNFR